jgi:hypothetical protein
MVHIQSRSAPLIVALAGASCFDPSRSLNVTAAHHRNFPVASMPRTSFVGLDGHSGWRGGTRFCPDRSQTGRRPLRFNQKGAIKPYQASTEFSVVATATACRLWLSDFCARTEPPVARNFAIRPSSLWRSRRAVCELQVVLLCLLQQHTNIDASISFIPMGRRPETNLMETLRKSPHADEKRLGLLWWHHTKMGRAGWRAPARL